MAKKAEAVASSEDDFDTLAELLKNEDKTLWEQAWFLAEKKFSDARLREFCRQHGRKASTFRKREKVGVEFPRGTVDTNLAFGVYETLTVIPTDDDRAAILNEGPINGGVWTIDKMKKRVRQWLTSEEGQAKLLLYGVTRKPRSGDKPHLKRSQGMRVGTTPEGGTTEYESYIRADLREDADSLEVTVLNPSIKYVDSKEVDGKVVLFLKFG